MSGAAGQIESGHCEVFSKKKGTGRPMKEFIFEFVNQYAIWGILILVFAAAFLLWRMHRQLKRLNRNLGMITGKIQEYFTVILEEAAPEETQRITPGEVRREERFLAQGERERLHTERKKQSPEEEAVFHSVMQEFFS